MPFSIALTEANLVPSPFNNTYKFNFPSSAYFGRGSKVALQSISMYYSWVNVSAAYGNNSFSYIWPVGPTTVTVILPDGNYSIADINSYLQSIMISNGHYLVNGSNQNVYYLEIVANSTYYSVQFNSFPIPTALPAGYSAPGGWPGYPGAASTPQFVVPSTPIRSIFGINAGTYPAAIQAIAYSKLSDFTPQVSPVSSVFVACSLLNNRLAIPSNLLYTFSPNVQYGSQIQVQLPYLLYQPVEQGTYPDVTITFLDQALNNLSIKDTNLVVNLTIKLPGEQD